MDWVMAYGGSVLAPENPDPDQYAAQVTMLAAHSRACKLVIVVGGGYSARQAIRLAKAGGTTGDALDLVGIAATRLHAETLRQSLLAQGVRVAPQVPESYDLCETLAHAHDVVVMGGVEPGQSTDAVATTMAARLSRKLLVASNVNGVYTADPAKDPSAVKLDKLGPEQLSKLCTTTTWQAGQAGVLDPRAAKIVLERSLAFVFVDGRNVANLAKALDGKEFEGSCYDPNLRQ